MTNQDALDCIYEHLTTLHANPNIYEDGTYKLIEALEDIVIPVLKNSIKIDETFTSCELRSEYRLEPTYTVDKDGQTKIVEVSIVCDPFEKNKN